MYELNPLIQVRFNGKTPVLDLLVDSKSFSIQDDRLLRVLPIIAKISPTSLANMEEEICSSGIASSIESKLLIEVFLEKRVLVDSTQIHSIKAGVQYWVDRGWVDALTLHLSSRNLEYEDDPFEFSGNNNIDYIPSVVRELELNEGITIALPEPTDDFTPGEVFSGIVRRRSFKPYEKTFASLEEVSNILWHANKYNKISEMKINPTAPDRRNVFDSAFTALKTYLVVFPNKSKNEGHINELEAGVYAYSKAEHSLIMMRKGDFSEDVIKIAIGQKRAGKGLITLIITADWESYRTIYEHSRSYRNLLINVAELAQYYLVLLTIYKFNTFITPALQDEKCISFLNIEKGLPLYIVGAG